MSLLCKRYENLQPLLDLYYLQLGWKCDGAGQYVYVGKVKPPEASLVNLDGTAITPEIEKARAAKEWLERITGTYVDSPRPITWATLGRNSVVATNAFPAFEKFLAAYQSRASLAEFLKAASAMEGVRDSQVLRRFESDLEITEPEMTAAWGRLIYLANKYNALVRRSVVAKHNHIPLVNVGSAVLLGLY